MFSDIFALTMTVYQANVFEGIVPKISFLSNLSVFCVPDECYSRNTSCPLNVLYLWIEWRSHMFL